MNTHTPGPWKVHYSEAVYVREEAGASICTIGHLKGDRFGSLGRKPVAESNANARLIAAAPELLYALRELIHTWPTYLPPGEPNHTIAMQVARAAIAKAEGRE